MFSDMDWLFHILGLLLLEAVIKLAIMQFFTPAFVSQRGNKQIGNGLYCSTGARILGDVSVGDSVTVGANAVLNHSVGSNSLVVGIPALKKRDEEAWYKGEYLRRVEECEKLRLSYE